jgi:O-antigen/teichoic acid export membrane protein
LVALSVGCLVWEKWISAEVPRFILTAGAIASLNLYPTIVMGVHLADNNALKYRFITLSGFLIQVATLGISLIFVKLNLEYVLALTFFANIVYAGLSISAVWNDQLNSSPKLSECLDLLVVGLPIVGYTIIGQFCDLFTRALAATKLGPADFGLYSGALTFASVVGMFASAVNLAWVPKYYRNAIEWHSEGIYNRFVELFNLITALFAMFVAVFSDELLKIYSGGKVQSDPSTITCLVVAAWLNSSVWMGLINPLFQQKKMNSVLIIVATAAVLSIPLTWFLIVQFGVFGASLSMVASALILCSCGAVFIRVLNVFKTSYTTTVFLLISIIIVSNPWLQKFFSQSPLTTRIGSKLIVITCFVALWMGYIFHRGVKIFRQIDGRL